jgi:hypothetical protein
MTAIAVKAPNLYITAAEAIRRHPSLNRARLYRMGLTRMIRVQLLPGIPPRYAAADLDRLMSAEAGERR